MGFYRNVLDGFYWIGSLRFLTKTLAFIKIVVLAGLLGPEEFGLFSIASLELVFLEIATETGINVFLIQEEEDIKENVNVAWVVSIIRGFLISFLIVIFSKPVATFFNSPKAIPILLLISLVPFLRGFINPALINFQKTLQFKKDSILRLSIYIIDTMVCIILAFYLKSPLVFVWGMIFAAIAEIILSFVFIRPHPKFILDKNKFKKVLSRGKWITISGLFKYLFENIDDMVVGKLINTYSLGLYQVAYKISSLPITESAEVLHKVTFPVFVKIKDDPIRLKKAFVKLFVTVFVLVIPLGAFIIVFTKPLVRIFLGESWLPIVSIVKVLAIYGVIRAVFGVSTPLFLALKKQNYITIITFIAILGMLLTIIPFVKTYGYLGAGYSALVGWLLAIPVIIIFLERSLSLNGKK